MWKTVEIKNYIRIKIHYLISKYTSKHTNLHGYNTFNIPIDFLCPQKNYFLREIKNVGQIG